MSTIGRETAALAESAASNKPRQGRSLASYARMLDATRELMLERGGENFTLQDVSDQGNVSIGSIYLRFESKDRLIHAVIAQELTTVLAGEKAMLETVLGKSEGLADFLTNFIDSYCSFLAEKAPMLRTIMQRASVDPAVSGPGRETARNSAQMATAAIMTFRDEIGGDQPEMKAKAIFQVIFATIARQFGLGATRESGDKEIWRVTKGELAKMALAYLRFEQ